MEDVSKYIVLLSFSIKEAVKTMDKGGIGFCTCVDNRGKVVGVVTDGDFRRSVLNGYNLEESVEKIINRKFFYVSPGYSNKEVSDIFATSVAKHVPVIDDGELIDIITEEKFFGLERGDDRAVINNPVVIMAGGKGTRMDPFTRILPKPLIPLGDDPMIKVIMDEFGKFGMTDFHLSLNDKGRMVKAYFYDHELPYNIQFIEEEKPLGTAGALKHLDGNIVEAFFVTNCDIIVHTDYSGILNFHVANSYDLTIVASMRHYIIPYGVCEISEGGELELIHEKPEHDMLVNTGLYLLEPDVLNLIPDNQYFDMTDLIKKIQANGLKVGVFPVSEKSWIDVGQWEEYTNAIKQF